MTFSELQPARKQVNGMSKSFIRAGPFNECGPDRLLPSLSNIIGTFSPSTHPNSTRHEARLSSDFAAQSRARQKVDSLKAKRE
jgi:hypothetical protein